jgi:hypothetical protein
MASENASMDSRGLYDEVIREIGRRPGANTIFSMRSNSAATIEATKVQLIRSVIIAYGSKIRLCVV